MMDYEIHLYCCKERGIFDFYCWVIFYCEATFKIIQPIFSKEVFDIVILLTNLCYGYEHFKVYLLEQS